MYTNWQSLGEVQYRKWEVYENLEWGYVNFEPLIIAGAPYGGPIAMVRDEKKIVHASEKDYVSNLRIFSSSGKVMADVKWDHKGLVGMGWTDQECLCCGFENGNVLVLDLQGKIINSFNILGEIGALGLLKVLEVRIWGEDIAVICDDMQIYLASRIETNSLRLYAISTNLSRENPYTSMAILPPQFTSSNLVEVFLGTKNCSVIVADENRAEDQQLQGRLEEVIIMMAVAPTGRFLACFTEAGKLIVMSTSLTTKVLTFDTSEKNKLLSLIWCGGDCVVLHGRTIGLLLVGPFGDWVRFQYQESLVLVSEADCCRIFTPKSCELLQRVPASTEAISKIGSTDPAAMLYDAAEAFEDGDPKADESVREMAASAGGIENLGSGSQGRGGQLVGAVAACINAAEAEFEPEAQKKMLKAASYGKGFLRDYDAGEFVDICRKLRVLNHVRRPEIGLPLTSQQYDRLTAEVLIERLLARNHHFLALKICQYLKLQQDHVLVHWACQELRSPSAKKMQDEEVRDKIRERLSSCRQVSYIQIASAADQAGRRRLATMLLDYEPRPAEQIPFLLAMQEEELALQKAINSDDTDLIYLAMLNMEQSTGDQQQFFRTIFNFPVAHSLLKLYYRHKTGSTDRDPLQQLCLARAQSQAINPVGVRQAYLEAGSAAVKQAYFQRNFDERMTRLKDALELFNKSKDLSFQKQMTEEQIELLEVQKELEQRTGHKVFVDKSVSDTIYNLICYAGDPNDRGSRGQIIDYMSEAAKIQSKFKVPKERFWHLKIKALASSGQWDKLQHFSGEKKSPIGYKPFAAACIKHRRPAVDIEFYIQKIPQPEDRFELFVEIKSFEKAMDCALKAKEVRRLVELQQLVVEPSLKKKLNDAIARMK